MTTQLEQLRGTAGAVRFPHVVTVTESQCHDGWRWQAWCATCRVRSPRLPLLSQAVDAVLGHPLRTSA